MALRADLADALAELSPKLRAVVVLRDVYELPHEDDRRRTRHQRDRRQGAPASGSAQLKERLFPAGGDRSTVPADTLELRRRRRGAQRAGRRRPPSTDAAVTSRRCLRCQADLVHYRRLLRTLRTLRTDVLEPAPGLLRRSSPASNRPASATPSAARSKAVVPPTSAASRLPPRPAPPAPSCSPAGHRKLKRVGRVTVRTSAGPAMGIPGAGASVYGSPPPRAVAQLAEHRSPKPAVGGSIPSCPAPARRLTGVSTSWP